ncbi:MAG: glycoside hydrolase, partial [Hymenobacter sp.]
MSIPWRLLTVAAPAPSPIVFADVPDMSMIRVVSNGYDALASTDALTLAHGKSTYWRGSWASSLRYHQGTYYVSTAQTTG